MSLGVRAFLSSAVSVSGSMLIGDAICQLLERASTSTWIAPSSGSPHTHSAFPLDVRRSSSMALTGLLVTGPFTHAVMVAIERRFPGASLHALLQKLACNYLVAPFSISAAFLSISLFQGKGAGGGVEKIREEIVSTYATASVFWPIVHLSNYRFVPVNHRTHVIGVAAAVWNVYLSARANKPNAHASSFQHPSHEQDTPPRTTE